MNASNYPLQLTNLTKRYNKKSPGIIELNLNVTKGEVFGFIGPNGAGKTTTIRTIMNFLRPTSGSATVFGLDSMKDSKVIKQHVGYLAGDIELYNNLTGQQYLAFMAHLQGANQKNVSEIVDRLNVTMHQKIHTLSRGNKQKIGLAAALVHDPDLLILDEPTTGLDPLMQNEFYELVRERAKRGKTVFISSHILSEVQVICDRVGFMRDGKLIETIDVAKLLGQDKKQITLTCKSGTKLMHLPHFKDLNVIHQTKEKITFTTSEAIKNVLKWLSIQPVEDVTIQNANLDEVFMKLYGTPHVADHEVDHV